MPKPVLHPSDHALSEFARLIRGQLEEQQAISCRVAFGDPFLDALYYGTLKSLIERVDSSGFCQTSYGEENGVKCYGYTHYPRDAAEAARFLATVGRPDLAASILGFTLDHCPSGQYHIPHVLRPDGSIKANTIQVDTPAHMSLALRQCFALAEAPGAKGLCVSHDAISRLVDRLYPRLINTCRHHDYPAFHLLDAGNYNEQGFGGGSERICDLFTNCSMFAGLSAMADISDKFAHKDVAAECRTRASALAGGIETSLSNGGRYFVKRDTVSGQESEEVFWLSLYCRRWYTGRPEAWESAFDSLQERTTLRWDDFDVISGDPRRARILGKYFAYLLVYLAETGRFNLLSRHLQFLRATVRRPSTLYPECWFYQKPAQDKPYYDWFDREFGSVWQPYLSDPDGDYTIDSGNCEQASAFMFHMVQDLLGISALPAGDGTLVLWPKLPFDLAVVSVEHFPVSLPSGGVSHISYTLRRTETSLAMDLRLPPSPIRLRVAIPALALQPRILVDGCPVSTLRITTQHEVGWLELRLNGDAAKMIQQVCVSW